MKNKKEDFSLVNLKKLNYILKVLDSCETIDQFNNAKNWGSKLLVDYYSNLSYINHYAEYVSGINTCKIFDEKVETKAKQMKNKVKPLA